MLIASIPTKMQIPWADTAVAPYVRTIPVPSQQGTQAGAASFTDGFPPANFLAIGAGGVPPFGEDFNGILKVVTEWLQWMQAGGAVPFDSTFQGLVGGYPLGALVPSASSATTGLYWFSTVDGNTTNPDLGGAGWTPVQLASGGIATTGSWTWRPTSETLPGWTKANGTTIGNAGSGASQLADASAAALFRWYWTNFSDAECPVSTGRGANAAADFAASKTLTVLDMRANGIIGMDTMGGSTTNRLAGVPISFGSGAQAGSFLGETLHQLVTNELAQHSHGVTDGGHNHTVSDPGHFHQITNNIVPALGTVFATTGGSGAGPGTATTDTKATGVTVNGNTTGITVNNAGANVSHNNVNLVITGTHYFKL